TSATGCSASSSCVQTSQTYGAQCGYSCCSLWRTMRYGVGVQCGAVLVVGMSGSFAKARRVGVVTADDGGTAGEGVRPAVGGVGGGGGGGGGVGGGGGGAGGGVGGGVGGVGGVGGGVGGVGGGANLHQGRSAPEILPGRSLTGVERLSGFSARVLARQGCTVH